MPQLYPRWADAVARAVLVCGVAVALGSPLLLMWWVRAPPVTGQFVRYAQPVSFDHRHHVADDGIDCLYCHVDAERTPYAGVPSTDVCLNCHGQIWNESPLLEAVRASARAGRPLAWTRVTFLPDFVYFNHAIHLRAGVGCETCHGRVDRMARVYQVAPMTMSWCLACHRNPAPYLRPRDAVTEMGYRGGAPAAVGLDPDRVRRLTDCTTCHR